VIVGAGVVVMLAAGIGWFWLQPAKAPEPVKTTVEPAKPSPPPGPAPTPSKPAPEPPPPVKPATPPTPAPEPAAAPTKGTLLIKSDVPDTSVFIDRVYLGTAPVTAKDLAPGTHHLNMSATGYDGVSEDIEVEVGSHELSKSFKTIVLDAKIDVIHKHTIGSCKGTLHATPEGIVYDTSNKDDKFSVALKDIEAFDVDYIGKSMTIKVRKGKTYKFEDPEGNADRLFVFQRDVDKVRKKLAGG
jgi:hypothetical protein